MGHLICVKECYNAANKPFKKGSMYKYHDDQFIDMMGVKYYHIYEVIRTPSDNGVKFRVSDSKFGTGRKEFIDLNFATVAIWSRLLKELDSVFDKGFYDGFGEFSEDVIEGLS